MFNSQAYTWPFPHLPTEHDPAHPRRQQIAPASFAWDQDAPVNSNFIQPQRQDQFISSSQNIEEDPHSHHEHEPNSFASWVSSTAYNPLSMFAHSFKQTVPLKQNDSSPMPLDLEPIQSTSSSHSNHSFNLMKHHRMLPAAGPSEQSGSAGMSSEALMTRFDNITQAYLDQHRSKQLHHGKPYEKSAPPRRHTFSASQAKQLFDLASNPAIPRQNFTTDRKQVIRGMLSKCIYGKNLPELLAPEKGFQAINELGNVKFINYNEAPRQTAPFKGVCNDLAYSVGKQVQHVLGDNFEVKVATGTYSEYYPNGTHYYLLVWPKTKNDQVLKALKAKQAIPKACLLIDPSFQQLLTPHQTKDRSRYTVNQVQDLESFHPDQIRNEYKAEKLPACIPIGFLRDVVPEAVEDYGQQSLLFLQFHAPQIPGDPPIIGAAVQRDPHSNHVDIATKIFDKVHSKNLFQDFYLKVLGDLNPPEGQLAKLTLNDRMQLDAPPAENSAKEWLPEDLPADWVRADAVTHTPATPNSIKLWG